MIKWLTAVILSWFGWEINFGVSGLGYFWWSKEETIFHQAWWGGGNQGRDDGVAEEADDGALGDDEWGGDGAGAAPELSHHWEAKEGSCHWIHDEP